MSNVNICNLLFSALKLQISKESGCSETLDLHFKMATLCPCVGRDGEVNVRDFHSPCAHWRQSTLSTLCPLLFSIQLVNTKVANCQIFYTNRKFAHLVNWALWELSGWRLKTKVSNIPGRTQIGPKSLLLTWNLKHRKANTFLNTAVEILRQDSLSHLSAFTRSGVQTPDVLCLKSFLSRLNTPNWCSNLPSLHLTLSTYKDPLE